MPPVQFHCSQCQKLMAVSPEYLGKKVRCPHCQQVVIAPPVAPVPTPANFAPPFPEVSLERHREEHESIFGEPVKDDLFDDEDQSPGVEMPAEPKPPAPSPPPPAPSPSIGLTSVPLFAPEKVGTSPAVENGAFGQPQEWTSGSEVSHSMSADAPRRVIVQQTTSRALIWFLSFLIPYAILMTAGTFYFMYRLSQVPSPLELLPDLPENKNYGTTKGQQTLRVLYQRAPVTTELPPHLRTRLGQPVQVGNVEVTPLKIEKRHIRYKSNVAGEQAESSDFDALVLTVQLKNISTDEFFDPTDPMFQRLYKDEAKATKPYTFLEFLDGKRQPIWGGPLELDQHNERIDGQEFGKRPLSPGAAVTTVYATPASDKVNRRLTGYQGEFLWRIQVRRGSVEYKGKQYSTTGVVGIEFSAAEIVSQKMSAQQS